MGVFRKKQISRGTEGGLKYICDVCSKDITATVRIKCNVCTEYDLCVPCFKDGSYSRDHKPAEHAYLVIEQHSIPVYDADWGADEELCLLEGAEAYGLGSWADIADHIGGYRTKDEVRDHYVDTYIDSPNFPLPKNADPSDTSLLEEVPRDEFQARKKRRIEQRKEETKTAPAAAPKQKPTASTPACHEVYGYMPGRLEFDIEYANEAEEAVQNMQFEAGNGIDPRTGELEPEAELKLVVMDIYNSRLTSRADRKKVIFEHNLLDYKKNVNMEKRKTKEEKALSDKARPFVRLMNFQDYEDFSQSLNEELNLRQAIAQLQDWRNMGLKTMKDGEKYEAEKQVRMMKPPATGMFDRQAGLGRTDKKVEQKTVADMCVELTAVELPDHLKPQPGVARVNGASGTATATNGTTDANGSTPTASAPTSSLNGTNPVHRFKYTVNPLPNPPREMASETVPDFHLLTKEEQEICSTLGIMPKPYLAMKDGVLREAMKNGGGLKRKGVKEMCKIDPSKSGRLFDFFVHSGWIQKA